MCNTLYNPIRRINSKRRKEVQPFRTRDMKLTKEHHKWIGESIPREGTSSAEKAHWISGAEEAIEKFGGIQWNKYPETKPTKDCECLAFDAKEGVIIIKYFVEGGFGFEGLVISHWAEINLPE